MALAYYGASKFEDFEVDDRRFQVPAATVSERRYRLDPILAEYIPTEQLDKFHKRAVDKWTAPFILVSSITSVLANMAERCSGPRNQEELLEKVYMEIRPKLREAAMTRKGKRNSIHDRVCDMVGIFKEALPDFELCSVDGMPGDSEASGGEHSESASNTSATLCAITDKHLHPASQLPAKPEFPFVLSPFMEKHMDPEMIEKWQAKTKEKGTWFAAEKLIAPLTATLRGKAGNWQTRRQVKQLRVYLRTDVRPMLRDASRWPEGGFTKIQDRIYAMGKIFEDVLPEFEPPVLKVTGGDGKKSEGKCQDHKKMAKKAAKAAVAEILLQEKGKKLYNVGPGYEAKEGNGETFQAAQRKHIAEVVLKALELDDEDDDKAEKEVSDAFLV